MWMVIDTGFCLWGFLDLQFLKNQNNSLTNSEIKPNLNCFFYFLFSACFNKNNMATLKAYEKIKKVNDAQACNELCTESKENGDGCQYFNFKVQIWYICICSFVCPPKNTGFSYFQTFCLWVTVLKTVFLWVTLLKIYYLSVTQQLVLLFQYSN